MVAANGRAFVLLGIRITKACLAVAFKNNIAAKLLQMIRITNVDERYSQAPMAQMQCWLPFTSFQANKALKISINMKITKE
jgi:hypothetical protein